MRVLPAAERPGSLHVAELPPLHVIAMLERPAQTERAHAHPHRSAIAVANSRRALDHFHALPRRRQPLQRPGLRVPAKQLLRGRLYPRRRYEQIRPRHILYSRPSRAAQLQLIFADAGSKSCHRPAAPRHTPTRFPCDVFAAEIASPGRSESRSNAAPFSAPGSASAPDCRRQPAIRRLSPASQRFRPSSFARYSAASASRKISCASRGVEQTLAVTPKLAVTEIGIGFAIIGLASIARRILSANPSVPLASDDGTTIRNSSPP